MIRMGDDVGAQQSMMLSPKMWRKLAKPRLQHMFNALGKKILKSLLSFTPVVTTPPYCQIS